MYLCKYVTSDRVDILRNAQIRFTQPTVFNDPFEMSPIVTALREVDDLSTEELEDVRRQYEELSAEQQQQVTFEEAVAKYVQYLNQVTKEDGSMDELLQQMLPKFFSDTGVLSLAEREDNLLMWSHYADQHRGFVIVFDGDHSFFNQRREDSEEFYYLQKVLYAIERPSSTFSRFIGPQTFLTKSKEWEYEQEWRMLIYFPNFSHRKAKGTPDVRLVSLPPECIVRIILGHRMPDDRKKEIFDLITKDDRYGHVEISQAELDSSTFSLTFHSLSEHYFERGKQSMQRAARWGAVTEQPSKYSHQWKPLLQTAIEDFTRAISLVPDDVRFLSIRAAGYQMLKKYKDAAADYSRAIEVAPEPQDGLLYALRGEIYLNLGLLQQAEDDYDWAVSLGMTDVEPYLEQIRQLRASQKTKASRKAPRPKPTKATARKSKKR